jgi:MFS family permease
VPHLDWLVQAYGVPLGLAGFAVSCVMLPGALAGWRFGAAVDRFGAKRVAIAGLLVAAAASLFTGTAESFPFLVALRILEGCGYTLLVVAATVIAAGVIPGRSALALSVWSSFAPIGFALGQWAGAFAANASPLVLIGVVHAAVLAAAAVALYAAVESHPPSRTQHEGGSSWNVVRHAPAQRTALAFGATCAVLLAAVALAPVVLASRTSLSVAHVASLTALAALPGIVGRIAPGWLLGRGVTPLAVFLWASIIAAVSILAALAAPVPLWPALAWFALFQIAAGALPGVLSAMIPQVAPGPGELGSVSGICTQMVNVGNLLGPPLALAVYAAAGPAAAAGLLVVLLAASVLAIAGLSVFRRRLSEAA